MATSVGSFGDLIFGAPDARLGIIPFETFNYTRNSRIFSHSTIEGLPRIESAGLESARVVMTGRLTKELYDDMEDALSKLMHLQDGEARPLVRGSRCYGDFVVESLAFSEDAWFGDGELAALSWTLNLIQQR